MYNYKISLQNNLHFILKIIWDGTKSPARVAGNPLVKNRWKLMQIGIAGKRPLVKIGYKNG